MGDSEKPLTQAVYGHVAGQFSGAVAGGCPARVTGKSGAFYSADLYENGVDSGSTGSATVYVLQLNFADTIPTGTWIVVAGSAMAVTGGGDAA